LYCSSFFADGGEQSSQLRSISFPSLSALNGDSPSISMSTNSLVEIISFPALVGKSNIDLIVVNTPSSINGSAIIEFPRLKMLKKLYISGCSIGSISFPELMTVETLTVTGANNVVPIATSIISFPMLTTVTGGGVSLSNGRSVSGILFPSLQDVAGSISISAFVNLSVADFSSLERVEGGDISISSNAKLAFVSFPLVNYLGSLTPSLNFNGNQLLASINIPNYGGSNNCSVAIAGSNLVVDLNQLRVAKTLLVSGVKSLSVSSLCRILQSATIVAPSNVTVCSNVIWGTLSASKVLFLPANACSCGNSTTAQAEFTSTSTVSRSVPTTTSRSITISESGLSTATRLSTTSSDLRTTTRIQSSTSRAPVSSSGSTATSVPLSTGPPLVTRTIVVVMSFQPNAQQLEKIIVILARLTGLPVSSFSITFRSKRWSSATLFINAVNANEAANQIEVAIRADPFYFSSRGSELPEVQLVSVSSSSPRMASCLVFCMIVVFAIL